jgi:cobalamin biosynthesis Mg chelatase CobN
MRQSSLWRLVFPRRVHTYSSETRVSDETTAAGPTASGAVSPRPHSGTGNHRHSNSRWTTPSAPRGSARPRTAETRPARTRRIVSDVAAIVMVVVSVVLLLFGIVWLASTIGAGP